MLAALVNVPAGIGYPLLFLLVAGESAGALVPGNVSVNAYVAARAPGHVIIVDPEAGVSGDRSRARRPASKVPQTASDEEPLTIRHAQDDQRAAVMLRPGEPDLAAGPSRRPPRGGPSVIGWARWFASCRLA
jgi:hypothetical protein